VNIDLKELGDLLSILEQHQIGEFEFENGGSRLHIKRGSVALAVPAVQTPILPGSAGGNAPAAPQATAGVAPAAQDTDSYVTSPFVGTFYRAPAPEAPPFVDVGSQVKKGQPLCIVEAMKLMNEIEADFACTIVECLVENGKPVEFGQKLFKVHKN
jgi:acetyl-CoA carboxylase biotin carboxyl carrier protein